MIRSVIALIFCLTFLSKGDVEAVFEEIVQIEINSKKFPATEEYFSAPVTQQTYKVYKEKNTGRPWNDNQISPEECVEYELGSQSFILFAPKKENENQPYGVYLHNSSGKRGVRPSPEWRKVFSDMNLIFISPNGAPNKSPTWRRIILALDSLATVENLYRIDQNRIFVGGISGGGHIGMMCQMLYPEIFNGAISHAAQSYLPDRDGLNGHFPGLNLRDAKTFPRKLRRWCVISGDQDYNYKEILQTSKHWLDNKFEYRFFDIEGMKHTNAEAKPLRNALEWLDKSPYDTTKSLRIWTATNGKQTTAKLIKNTGSSVILKKQNGSQITVAHSKLSPQDILYLASFSD